MQGAYFHRRGDWARWPRSGQGGAFRQVGETKVAVFTVVNAYGTVVDRAGRVVRCGAGPTEDCGQVSELLARTGGGPDPPAGATQNTTITLVVTNQRLAFADLERLAIQVHTSMGRAIQPFATSQDGDLLYAATTDDVDNPDVSAFDLGVLASEVAWDAVLASVPD